jgi:hypothetical protein
MEELQKRLESLGAWTGKGPPPAFQALLRVDVERGHDVLDVHLVTVHTAHRYDTAVFGACLPDRLDLQSRM